MTDSRSGALPAPLDLAHLRRQTGGDSALEREVLALFLSKAAADLDRILAAMTPGERSDAAHSLAGSARAVGAADVARLAGAVASAPGAVPDDVSALADAVAEACAFVRLHLAA